MKKEWPQERMATLKPFVKWAGGKDQLLLNIIPNLPQDREHLTRYIEPFIGGGAVFFYLIEHDYFQEYYINDINSKLINVYKAIRDNVDELILLLEQMKQQYNSLEKQEDKEKYYYGIRDNFNASTAINLEMASFFIFLNKTCFNGLYRENKSGLFNVPFGKYKNPNIYNEKQLKDISKALNLKDAQGEFRVHLINSSYEEIESFANENTFVYFDPPYRPITKGGFNSYNKSGFGDKEQIQLSEFCKKLNKTGTKFMLSNSDPKNLNTEDDFFDNLYRDFNITRVTATRMINSKSTGRGEITEILVKNYQK